MSVHISTATPDLNSIAIGETTHSISPVSVRGSDTSGGALPVTRAPTAYHACLVTGDAAVSARLAHRADLAARATASSATTWHRAARAASKHQHHRRHTEKDQSHLAIVGARIVVVQFSAEAAR